MIKIKSLMPKKSDKVRESFTREVRVVCDDFTVESHEKNIHDKVMQKVTVVQKDGEKYFDLEEYKNIMLHNFNYELEYFKSCKKEIDKKELSDATNDLKNLIKDSTILTTEDYQ